MLLLTLTSLTSRLPPILDVGISSNLLRRAGCDTRSILRVDLNLEFSFSKVCCITKAYKISQPFYLPIAGWRYKKDEFLLFPRKDY